jgi:hypothetical protein
VHSEDFFTLDKIITDCALIGHIHKVIGKKRILLF